MTQNLIAEITTLSIDDILSAWVRLFCMYGIHPPQVDIMFDSFQERDDGTMDDSQLCFAVFIHKHSGQPNFVFPEHDHAWGYIAHLPFDQACFPVWIDLKENTTIVCDPMTELCMADMDYIIHQIEYLRQIGQPQINTRESLDPK